MLFQDDRAISEVAFDKETDGILVDTDVNGLAQLHEISRDSLKLCGRHAHDRVVVVLGDCQLVGFNVQQLQVVLADSSLLYGV